MLIKAALITAAFASMVTAGSVCKYTKRCYGIAYGGGYVCGQEYPNGGRSTGNKKACDGFALYAHECCGITKDITNECKWSYCAGALIDGQTTCNDYGAGWKYNGEYSGADCGFFSTNSKVKCCKEESY